MNFLSVIIPALNEKENLEILIPYLSGLADADEIIIVEAAGTVDFYLPQHRKVRVIRSSWNSRAFQMNEGAAHSAGNILVFLHADVTPHPRSFTTVKQQVDRGFLFGFFSYDFVPAGFLLNINAAYTRKDGIFAGGGDQIHFVERSIFENAGGYDIEYVIMEDFAFTRKVKKSKIPYTIINLPAKVSSRKYQKNCYVKVNFVNLVAMTMFYCNISSTLIRNWTRFMLK